MKKITVITGTRAEFGLLRPLIDLISQSENLELQLFVTAMHLSPEFGYTISEIENANYKISKKVECLLSSDSAVGISKSIGLAMIGFADAFEELKPDFVFILGDRTEALAAATSAMIANIPIGHIHGGETTEGAYDESIRHAITKMSYLHFTSTEEYRKRVIQLGEAPERVFNTGGIGLDSIQNLNLLSREEFENSIGFKLGIKNILITFHPVTLETNSAKDQFQIILNFLNTLCDTKLIFTYANSDKNGRVINEMIENFVSENKEKSTSFRSLGQIRYLSALQFVDIVVGNSSSGIIEAPYFNIPTINIGDRQKGRVMAESIIQAEPRNASLEKAFIKAFDPAFRDKIKTQEQIYGNGNAANKIMRIINTFSIENLKKKFYNLNFKSES